MGGVVTTSLVIQFGSEDDAAQYHLSAEVDSRDDGLNGGNTSFLPGDQPYFLVYYSPELSLTLQASEGTIVASTPQDITIEEYITFADAKEANLSKPVKDGTTPTLEELSVVGTPGTLQRTGQTLYYNTKAIAVIKATYTTRAKAYQLTSTPTSLGGNTSFPIVIVITGTAS